MFAVVLRRFVLALCAGVGLAGVSAASGAELAPTDRLLPPNALVYFRIPNCTMLQQQFAETGFGELVHDPAMAAVREAVMKKFEENSREVEDKLGMPLSDLLAIPTGEAAMALVQPPGKKLGFALFLDVQGHADLLEKLIDKGEEGLSDEGTLTRSSKTFEGTEITVWTNEDAGPREPFNGFCYCVKDERLVLASTVDLAEAILTRWDGQHDKTFASDATYKYILTRCGFDGDKEPAMSWFVNPLGLFKAGMAAAGPEFGMQGAMVMGFLPVLGLDKLKGIGGTSELGVGDYESISKSVLYVDQPTSGILKALVCPPADLTPPKFIGADTSTITGVNWDVQGAYEAIGQTWDFFTAPGTFGKMMDDAVRDPRGPGLHPKADIIDLLTGRIYLLQDFPADGDLEQQQMAFLFGVNDTRKMQDVITKITNLEGAQVSVRDFGGTSIYEPQNAAGGPFSPAVAVANGYMIFAMNVELLEGMLRADVNEPLALSPDYQRVMKEFPGQVSAFSFQRQDAIFGAFYEAMKNQLRENPPEDFDVSILPEFEDLRKYFGIMASYTVPDENGAFSVSFTLKRE